MTEYRSGNQYRNNDPSRVRRVDPSSRQQNARPSGQQSSSYASDGRTPRTGARQSAASRRRKLYLRRKRKFKRMLLIYIAILVILLIIGSIAFSSYLSSYENALPSHIAETIVKSYASQQGIIDFVTTNADRSDLMGNVDEIAQLYATNIAGKSVSYKENKDFRPDTPSYDIIADGNTAAKVTLIQDGKKWAISRLELIKYLPDTMSAKIEVPAGSSVTVNGMKLDESYITESRVPAVLENSLKYIADPPKNDIYEISGLLSEPVISVASASGEPLELVKEDDRYAVKRGADPQFIESVAERVDDAIWNYATYFIHMSFDLSHYIVYGTDLYSSIFGSDDMDPIDTNLYMWEWIDKYEFAERSAGNYVQYSDDCFTVDVKYALDMYFTDPTYSDNNQKTDATWVFVIEPLDGSWCISDTIEH